MAMPDFFNTDGFNLVSLTTSINKLPFKPKRIADMGLFSTQGVNTNTVIIEEDKGMLALLPSKTRGEAGTLHRRSLRTVRSFVIPHIPYEDRIEAASLQGVRKFGSEDQTDSVVAVVNDRLKKMKQSHETTLEWLRIGAIHGKVIDGDGTTELYDLFSEFGVSAPSDVDFLLGTDTTQIRNLLLGVKETIEDGLGDEGYDHIHAFCGKTWFKAFVEHPEVKYAYQYFQDGQMLRNDPRAGFEYAGVTFEVYRGKIGTKSFVADGDVRFFPVGTPDLFVTFFGPADFNETVNTIGLPMYAKQEPMEFDRGTKLHTQSNPLPICTRPLTLVRGHTSN